MKTLNYLAVTAAVVTLNLPVCAGESVLSPKAAQLQHELRKVSRVASEPDLTKVRPAGNAKAWSLAWDLRKVAGTGLDSDLAHAPLPTMSPKDPRYEVAVRSNAVGKTARVGALKYGALK